MDAKNRIIEEIKEYEWDNIDNVIKSIIPNIIFAVREDQSEINLLDSRFGGKPAVPNDFKWPLQPESQNSPLAFFFQLNFEQIKPVDIENVLPDQGMLLCFASVTDDVMYEPEITDTFKIYYFPDTDMLSLAEIPEDIPSNQRLEPRSVSYKTSFQLPRYPFNYSMEELTEDDADGIDQVANSMFDEAYGMTMRIQMTKNAGLSPPTPKDDFHTLFSHNLLLGVPFSVQHFIAEEWSEEYSENYEEAESEDYVNLISFEMKHREGYGFSDNGAHLYLCIHQEDLKNKDFGKTICIIQNS